MIKVIKQQLDVTVLRAKTTTPQAKTAYTRIVHRA